MTAAELEFAEPPEPRRHAGGKSKRSAGVRTSRPTYIAPDSHRPHGTHVKYVVERCTCEPCRQANRDYERARQHAINRPDEVWAPYVSALRARRHLEELADAGVGYKTVARIAGLPVSSVGKILWPSTYRGMGRSKRIRPGTERRILAVTVDQADGGQKIPGAATWRLLDDLVARGFTKIWIAQQIVGPTARSLQVRRGVVRASTARKVEDLHRRLVDVAPPPHRTRWST